MISKNNQLNIFLFVDDTNTVNEPLNAHSPLAQWLRASNIFNKFVSQHLSGAGRVPLLTSVGI